MGTTDGYMEDDIKVECMKLSIPDFGEGGIIVRKNKAGIEELWEEIESGAAGDSFKITLLEMTQTELENLPEFEGW